MYHCFIRWFYAFEKATIPSDYKYLRVVLFWLHKPLDIVSAWINSYLAIILFCQSEYMELPAYKTMA